MRPYPQFSGVTYFWGSFSHSSYHALQAKFRRRYRGGIQLLAAYTWSKSLDDFSGSATGGNQNPGFTNNNRRDLDKSYSTYDIPHRFVASLASELPFGAGRRLLNHKGIGNAFYGGWRLGAIVSLQSGPPISVSSSVNATGSFGGGQRPNRTGVSSRTPGSVEDRLDNYIARAAFVNPPPYTFGNAGRFLPENRAPGLVNCNLSLAKSFHPIERLRLDVRGEAFNLLNHPNFRIFGTSTSYGLPQFGTITATESQRQVTFTLKLYF